MAHPLRRGKPAKSGTAAPPSAPRRDALGKLTRAAPDQRGRIGADGLAAFLDAGRARENLVDHFVAIGDWTVTESRHAAT